MTDLQKHGIRGIMKNKVLSNKDLEAEAKKLGIDKDFLTDKGNLNMDKWVDHITGRLILSIGKGDFKSEVYQQVLQVATVFSRFKR